MSAALFSFRRPNLAANYCDALVGTGIIDARSGLFLAAPRRTGKSTFLREDLLPAMLDRGWTTVYVDLWSNRAADPANLIAAAVKSALSKFNGVITKLAKATGLEKVNVFGALSLNFHSLDLPPNVTLLDALEALQTAAAAPVVVIIDEAQHAISTQAGMDAMFALKAARDHLNQSLDGKQKLYLVFTGSNQDKLSRLVLKKAQPFYGCQVSRFPLLEDGYSDAYTDYINKKLSENNQFNKQVVWSAFKLVGQRPEMLRGIIGDLALDGGADALQDALNAGAHAFQERIWGEMESEFNALTTIQRAVLIRIIEAGKDYEPFNDASLRAYQAYVGKKVNTSEAQGALAALREKNLVWQAAYGDYALEDESIVAWFNSQVKSKLSTMPISTPP